MINSYGQVVKYNLETCQLQIKSAPFLTDFHFKSAHLGFEVIGVIHRGVESGEILARPPRGGAGRPGGKNLEALVALCG